VLIETKTILIMKKGLNHIGLDAAKSKKLAVQLNQLLTNLQLFYMNTRGYHWNIKGSDFFELHVKFEEIYTDLALKIDEVAERILTLGETPTHAYSDYLKQADIKEHKNVTDGKSALKQIIESYGVIIQLERNILNMSEDANDNGTADLMGTYIGAQEKNVWMYSAYLKK
jgi:starvation-inducible DNA-binding protein